MGLFCKHNWKLKYEKVTESNLSEFRRNIRESRGGPIRYYDPTKKYIQIFACTKCGKLKKFVEATGL